MASLRRGEVYLTTYDFPHERQLTQASEKVRPVLIVQTDADNANDRYPIVQAAPITSRKTDRILAQDVLLPAGEANLKVTSKVLLGLTQPFRKTDLHTRLGRLSRAKVREIDTKLRRLYGLTPTRR